MRQLGNAWCFTSTISIFIFDTKQKLPSFPYKFKYLLQFEFLSAPPTPSKSDPKISRSSLKWGDDTMTLQKKT